MESHSGQYTRKVIVDKYPPAFADKVTQFDDPNGIKYELTLTLPQDLQTFLDYYDTPKDNQGGTAGVFFKSPWLFADGREEHIYRLRGENP